MYLDGEKRFVANVTSVLLSSPFPLDTQTKSNLWGNSLTTLPEDIFEDLEALTSL